MRILFCYPWLKLGGAPLDVITLARGLVNKGHEVVLFTQTGGMYDYLLEGSGIEVVSAPYSRWNPNLFHLNREAFRVFRDTLESRDIQVVHAFHNNSYYLSLFAAPGRKIPVVLSQVWFAHYVRFPSYPVRAIFVAEEFRVQALEYFRRPPIETYVIPNRLDTDMFNPDNDPGDLPEKLGLVRDGWKIAFMSRVDSWKLGSLRYAIDAAVLLSREKDVTLAIAGGGPALGELEEYARLANEKSGREVVSLVGVVRDTSSFLAWSDLVIGIGRCAWEGMATGKPTLVVGENGLAGVVEPDRVEELAYHNFAGRNIKDPVPVDVLSNSIIEIMQNGELREELSEFSRRYVVENFDYRRGVEKLEEIYRDALSDPAPGPAGRIRIYASDAVFGFGYQAWLGMKEMMRSLLRGGSA